MADQMRKRPSKGYYKQLSLVTSEFLELSWRKRKASSRGTMDKVERVISRRTVDGKKEYLIKWEGYSYFCCTWEEEDNLTTDLVRTFQRPFIPQARLQENIDRLLLAITVKLKSKSSGPTVLHFHHDCYRYLFFNKGRPSKDGKSTMLEKNDFAPCNFHDLWEQCLDKNGDGVRIKFPLKMHLTLTWSPKISAVQGGTLVIPPRMPLEKRMIDFVRHPFSILNA